MLRKLVFAGTRPGGRDTFLLRGKKVPKRVWQMRRPAAPALRAALASDYRVGRPLNSLRSNNAAGHPRRDSPTLGGAEGKFAGTGTRCLQTTSTLSRPSAHSKFSGRYLISAVVPSDNPREQVLDLNGQWCRPLQPVRYAGLVASSTLYFSTRAACSSLIPSIPGRSASDSTSKPRQISMSFCER